MNGNIKPTPDRIERGVLPRLEPVSMVEIMCGLPEVKDLIAVLDGRKKRCNSIGDDAYIERYV
jgi:hypothetical protein